VANRTNLYAAWEDEYLKLEFPRGDPEKIVARLGREWRAIGEHCRKSLGIKREYKKNWSEYHLCQLHIRYAFDTLEFMEKFFGRSRNEIKRKANEEGLLRRWFAVKPVKKTARMERSIREHHDNMIKKYFGGDAHR